MLEGGEEQRRKGNKSSPGAPLSFSSKLEWEQFFRGQGVGASVMHRVQKENVGSVCFPETNDETGEEA